MATAAFPGIGLGQAFVGEIIAIGVLTGLTALGALRELAPGRRTAGRGAGRPPLPRRLLLRPGRLQGDRRGPLRPHLRRLPLDSTPTGRTRRAEPSARRRGWAAAAAAAAGAGRRHLLLLQLRRDRLAGRDRRPLEPDPAGGAAGAAAAGAAALPAAADDAAGARRRSPGSPWWPPWSGPSASPAASTRSPAATPTARSRRSRRWGSGRPPTTGSTPPAAPTLPGLAGAIAVLALLVGVAWWVRRRELTIPIALGACAAPLPRLAPLQRRLLPGQGADDRRPAGDAGRDPPAAQRVRAARTGRRPLATIPAHRRSGAGWLGGAGGGLHRRRGLLELPGAARRAGRAARARRRAAGLPADRPRPAGALRGPGPLRRLRAARAPTRTCRWSSSPTPTSRPTRRSRSTPATPTARSTSTPSRAGRSNASTT